jgi:hypothetical protein
MLRYLGLAVAPVRLGVSGIGAGLTTVCTSHARTKRQGNQQHGHKRHELLHNSLLLFEKRSGLASSGFSGAPPEPVKITDLQ